MVFCNYLYCGEKKIRFSDNLNAVLTLKNFSLNLFVMSDYLRSMLRYELLQLHGNRKGFRYRQLQSL